MIEPWNQALFQEYLKGNYCPKKEKSQWRKDFEKYMEEQRWKEATCEAFGYQTKILGR